MWYRNGNANDDRPPSLDNTSSKVYTYIRKDFELIPAENDGDFEHPAHWEWLETKIPKETLELYNQIVGHDTALDDVYAALTELAEIIAGEE